MEKFSIESLPEVIVASHREIISDYAVFDNLCVNKNDPEIQRLDLNTLSQLSITKNTHQEILILSAVPKALCMKHYGAYDRLIIHQNLCLYGEERL